MSKNSEQTFIFLRYPTARAERCSQTSFMPRKSAFDLPTLSINATEKAFFHLTTVFCYRPFQRVALANRNHCGADAQGFATQNMIRLRIVSGIAQNLIPRCLRYRLVQNGSKLRRVVRRPQADNSPRQQMALSVTGNGQFRPWKSSKTLTSTPDIVAADMTGFHAGRIDDKPRVFINEFALMGSTENDC